jgi:hypothetical protein
MRHGAIYYKHGGSGVSMIHLHWWGVRQWTLPLVQLRVTPRKTMVSRARLNIVVGE